MEAQGIDLYMEMYTIILDELCKSGRLDSAWDLFTSLYVKGLRPSVKTYTVMIAGLLIEAKELLKKTEENGCSGKNVIFNVILQGLLRAGQNDHMVVYHEEILAGFIYFCHFTRF